MNKILVEAHRGYCAKYPENTLISFEAAMDMGVDGIELDVWLSADNVPVVIHDGNCNRTCSENVHVKDLTLEQIKKLSAHYPKKFGDEFAGQNITIPTLEEVLQLRAKKRPDLLIGVELKQTSEEYVDTIVALTKKYNAFEYCCFFTFDAAVIKYLATRHQAHTLGFPDFLMRNYEPDSYSYYTDFGVAVAYAKSEIFPLYESKGMPLQMYCADTEADAKVCIEKGATLVMANDPVPMMKALGRL